MKLKDLIAISLITASVAVFAENNAANSDISPELRQKAEKSIEKGLVWLAAQQSENGNWSQPQFPAVTAMALWGILNNGNPDYADKADKAIAYIKGCVQPDGGIYCKVEGRTGGGLSNYNTAICMTVLHATKREEFVPIVLNARRFIANAQHFGDDIYRGGFGYDKQTERTYTDLMNTVFSMEAMSRTRDVEDKRPKGEKKATIDWDAALKFAESLQNKDDSTPEDSGGFHYHPNNPKSGITTNDVGKVVLRSYGSMTYAGLLSLVYAQVDHTDPRVRSALDWAARNWSLQENPGMGTQGLFFYFNVMSRSLNISGQQLIENKAGAKPIDWRGELIERIISLQKKDGQWQNETARFWENDPSLVTAYSILSLQYAIGQVD